MPTKKNIVQLLGNRKPNYDDISKLWLKDSLGNIVYGIKIIDENKLVPKAKRIKAESFQINFDSIVGQNIGELEISFKKEKFKIPKKRILGIINQQDLSLFLPKWLIILNDNKLGKLKK